MEEQKSPIEALLRFFRPYDPVWPEEKRKAWLADFGDFCLFVAVGRRPRHCRKYGKRRGKHGQKKELLPSRQRSTGAGDHSGA